MVHNLGNFGWAVAVSQSRWFVNLDVGWLAATVLPISVASGRAGVHGFECDKKIASGLLVTSIFHLCRFTESTIVTVSISGCLNSTAGKPQRYEGSTTKCDRYF